jgi:hypothetical protein
LEPGTPTLILGAITFVIGIASTRLLLDGWRPRWPRRRTSWLQEATRSRILVNTIDGQTIEGSLVRCDADGIVVDAVRHADARQDLAGIAFIPRERISWVQQPNRTDGS